MSVMPVLIEAPSGFRSWIDGPETKANPGAT